MLTVGAVADGSGSIKMPDCLVVTTGPMPRWIVGVGLSVHVVDCEVGPRSGGESTGIETWRLGKSIGGMTPAGSPICSSPY